jgi:plasmid stabilization system protein ParE
MLTISRRRVFINELLDIAEFLGVDDPDAGRRFIDACEETFADLAAMPHLGSKRSFDHPDLKEVRMWHVKNYREYLIFYKPTKSTLHLLHLVHGARDYKTLFAQKRRRRH